MDERKHRIEEKRLTAVPLKEEWIIAKSIEFFNDPEPCMIHRSAVMNRIFMELAEYIVQGMQEGRREIAWDALPGSLKAYIQEPPNTHFLEIKCP